MPQDATVSSAALDYETPPVRPSSPRPWIPVALLVLIWFGENAIPRNSRWPWPMPEDYVLFVFLLAGAFLLSLLTSLRGEIVGLYGVVGLLPFWPGQFYHWNGPRYESSAWPRACCWVITFVLVWAFCRATVVLRRHRPAA